MEEPLGILIKRPETEEKIRELADRTGMTITDAVDQAVAEQLARLGPRKGTGRVNWDRLQTLLAKVKASPSINEGLTDDEIIGYDDDGVPR